MSMDPPTNPKTATFELKAGSFTFPVLRLLGDDLEGLGEQLKVQVERAPEFFRNTPVVIDLSPMEGLEVDLPLLVGVIRGHSMMPIGVRGGDAIQQESAQLLELALLGDARPAPPPEPQVVQPSPPPEPRTEGHNRLVTRPVRSGQKVYARGGDLIVVAPVSPGAELMADGNIHVYAALRGRVMAGIQGDETARIFCHQFGAELVSIAGRYRISEDIDRELIGQAVQVHLSGDRMVIERI